MGYVIKKATGSGGGDATAANQVIQINQEALAALQTTQITEAIATNAFITDSGGNSVFKDSNNDSNFQEVNGRSVFKDNISESVLANATSRSVFKDESTSDSVFKDINQESVFTEPNSIISVFKKQSGESAFTYSGDSLLEKSILTINNTQVTSFANSSPASLAADMQTFFATNNVYVISISYADGGVIGPNQHSAIMVYNIV
jgi:hypothetical protein